MARIRSIKPEFFTSEVIASLPISARLTFIGLWTYVDDNGVGVDAECTTCGARVTSPGGRTLHRSGRHSEQDPAVMQRRREVWAEHAAFARGEAA